MKYILEFNPIFEEALPINLAKKYVKIGEERNPVTTAKMDVIFNNKQRLYLPIVKKVKSTVEPQIKEFLETIGYGIKDYIGNLAFKLDNPKREVKIGKLLSQNNKEDLRDLFLRDPIRELATQQAEYSVVISRHPYDIAGTSTGTGREAWHSSCLNINGGCNSHYIPAEIKNGTLTAYYIKSSDKNINKPLGRVNVKPYKKESELNQKDKQKCYFPDTRIYGSFPPDALLALKEWIISWQGDLTGDFYKWKGCYDYDGTAYHINVQPKMKINQIEATKGNRNVDNFEIVNDVVPGNDDNWGDGGARPNWEMQDLLEFGRASVFNNYVYQNSDIPVDFIYHVESEQMMGHWAIVPYESFIFYTLNNLIVDYSRTETPFADGSFDIFGVDDEPRLAVKSVHDLTFKNMNINHLIKFIPIAEYGDGMGITGLVTFKDCKYTALDLPINPRDRELLTLDWNNDTVFPERSFGNLDMSEVSEVIISGGGIINAFNILIIVSQIRNETGGMFPTNQDILIKLENIDMRDEKYLEKLKTLIFKIEQTPSVGAMVKWEHK